MRALPQVGPSLLTHLRFVCGGQTRISARRWVSGRRTLYRRIVQAQATPESPQISYPLFLNTVSGFPSWLSPSFERCRYGGSAKVASADARRRYGNANITAKDLQELSYKTTSSMSQWKETLPNQLQLERSPTSSLTPQLLVLQ